MSDRKTNERDAIYQSLFPVAATRQQRRQVQIIEAAIQSYVRDGVENTTFERLAQRCRVTRPLIHHYFKDKRTLFEMAVKFIRIKFQNLAVEALKREASPLKQLDAYVLSTFDAIEAYPQYAHVWHLFYYYCGVDKRLKALNSEFVDMGHARIEAILEAGVREGTLPKMDCRARAKSIQVLLTGALNTVATENLYVSIEKFRKQVFEDYRTLVLAP